MKSAFPTRRSSRPNTAKQAVRAPARRAATAHACATLEGSRWPERQEENPAGPPGKAMPQPSPVQEEAEWAGERGKG